MLGNELFPVIHCVHARCLSKGLAHSISCKLPDSLSLRAHKAHGASLVQSHRGARLWAWAVRLRACSLTSPLRCRGDISPTVPEEAASSRWQAGDVQPLLVTVNFQFISVAQSCPNSLQPHGLQHARLPCPPAPGACSNSCTLSQWCHLILFKFIVYSDFIELNV